MVSELLSLFLFLFVVVVYGWMRKVGGEDVNYGLLFRVYGQDKWYQKNENLERRVEWRVVITVLVIGVVRRLGYIGCLLGLCV